jgi:hypothetical protein
LFLLRAYFDQSDIELSNPQRQHMLNLVNVLTVCEAKKTLAAPQIWFILPKGGLDYKKLRW